MVACHRAAAKRLDDHISPASDIAIAVDNACTAEREYVIAVFAQGMNNSARQMLADRIRARGASTAVQAVLIERQTK